MFNENGRLVELTKKESELFDKYGKLKTFPDNLTLNEKNILQNLCDLELIDYKDYNPKITKKNFSHKLYYSDSGKSIHPAPLLAHLAITSLCNMRCKYCSVRENHAHQDGRELTTEEWKIIIKKLSDAGVFQIGFTGGEPTLRKDIIELMKYTEDMGCVCNLTTNGWLFTKEFARKMADTKIKQCQISLDSFDKNIHDGLRGAGSLERVEKTISLLHDEGIHVGIDCVVSKNNIRDIPNMIRECEKRKVEYVTLIKLKKGDLDEKTFQELVPDYDEYGKLIESLCFRENKMPNVTIDCASISNLQYTLKDEELTRIPTAGCPIGHNLICISPNGDIYPCAALMGPEFRLGNILKDDFKEIWNNNPVLKNLRSIKRNVVGKCKNCPRLDFCRGGCRGISQTLAGDLFAGDKSCKFGGGKNG